MPNKSTHPQSNRTVFRRFSKHTTHSSLSGMLVLVDTLRRCDDLNSFTFFVTCHLLYQLHSLRVNTRPRPPRQPYSTNLDTLAENARLATISEYVLRDRMYGNDLVDFMSCTTPLSSIATSPMTVKCPFGMSTRSIVSIPIYIKRVSPTTLTGCSLK